MVTRRALIVVAATGCAARAHPGAARIPGDEITMYRDRALISQRVEVDTTPGHPRTITVLIPAGLTANDVVVLDRGELTISELRAVDTQSTRATDAATGDDRAGDAEDTAEDAAGNGTLPPTPTELTFVVDAPRAGHHAFHLGYVTPHLHWEAAYTMTTTAARERVTLRGAIAIRNETGTGFKRARMFVVDAELGAWRGRIAEQLGSALVGTLASTTPLAVPRDLGQIELGTGDTRVELLAADPPRKMRSVLVYDPVGTRLDHAGPSPIRDVRLGIEPAAEARVTESFEIARAESTSVGLPGGPVRLLERHPDGSLAMLGESRLFDAATRVADVDTVAIGTADGVTGHRERREITVDDESKRLVEEFVLTIANTRAHPVEVVLREHLYRGQNWSLAYSSAPNAAQEGSQQISLRSSVPANGEIRVLYVVVYTWL